MARRGVAGLYGQRRCFARDHFTAMIGHIIVVMKRKGEPGSNGVAHVAAADFKARCLELMDRVRETGAEYVVTKHGRPVARLVRYDEPARKPLFGAMKGTVLKYERPLDPIEADYDLDRD
jgi:prevent-host-death family protein